MKLSRIPGLMALVACASLLAGCVSNTAVRLANDGFMPVWFSVCQPYQDDVIDLKHVCYGPHAHLLILSDWISYHDTIYSIGDILLNIGDIVGIAAGFALVVAIIIKLLLKLRK